MSKNENRFTNNIGGQVVGNLEVTKEEKRKAKNVVRKLMENKGKPKKGKA